MSDWDDKPLDFHSRVFQQLNKVSAHLPHDITQALTRKVDPVRGMPGTYTAALLWGKTPLYAEEFGEGPMGEMMINNVIPSRRAEFMNRNPRYGIAPFDPDDELRGVFNAH